MAQSIKLFNGGGGCSSKVGTEKKGSRKGNSDRRWVKAEKDLLEGGLKELISWFSEDGGVRRELSGD